MHDTDSFLKLTWGKDQSVLKASLVWIYNQSQGNRVSAGKHFDMLKVSL